MCAEGLCEKQLHRCNAGWPNSCKELLKSPAPLLFPIVSRNPKKEGILLWEFLVCLPFQKGFRSYNG